MVEEHEIIARPTQRSLMVRLLIANHQTHRCILQTSVHQVASIFVLPGSSAPLPEDHLHTLLNAAFRPDVCSPYPSPPSLFYSFSTYICHETDHIWAQCFDQILLPCY